MGNNTKELMKKLLLAVSLLCLFVQPAPVHAVRSQTINQVSLGIGVLFLAFYQNKFSNKNPQVFGFSLMISGATWGLGHLLFTTPEYRLDNAIALLDQIEADLPIVGMFSTSASDVTVDALVNTIYPPTADCFVVLATIEQLQKSAVKAVESLALAKTEMREDLGFCAACKDIESRAVITVKKLFKLSAMFKARVIASAETLTA